MRKILALLLLLILPLQFAWAGAGVYCQHEEGQAAQHFGHHEHQQAADESSGSTYAEAGSSDCSLHLPSVKGCIQIPTLSSPPLSAVLNSSPPRAFTSFIPDGPERPDRLLPVVLTTAGEAPLFS